MWSDHWYSELQHGSVYVQLYLQRSVSWNQSQYIFLSVDLHIFLKLKRWKKILATGCLAVGPASSGGSGQIGQHPIFSSSLMFLLEEICADIWVELQQASFCFTGTQYHNRQVFQWHCSSWDWPLLLSGAISLSTGWRSLASLIFSSFSRKLTPTLPIVTSIPANWYFFLYLHTHQKSSSQNTSIRCESF